MDAKPFDTAHLSELDAIQVSGTLVWRPIRRRFDVRAFGVNAYTAKNSGDELVEDHDEQGGFGGGHQELYFVVSGHARFTLGQDELDAPAGTFVFIRDPSLRRHAVATEPDSTVLAIGGPRGEAFEPSAWEHYFAAIPFARAGDYARAKEIAATGLAEHPDNASLLYDVACYEALGGEHDAAVERLARAFELDPSLREQAKTDANLDAIRDRADFPA